MTAAKSTRGSVVNDRVRRAAVAALCSATAVMGGALLWSGAASGQSQTGRGVALSTPRILPPTAEGRVTSVGTNTFTIQDRRSNSIVVNVSPTSTTYEELGVTAASFLNVVVGADVAVIGTAVPGVVTATDVRIEVKDPRATKPTAIGQVTSVGTNTFTIKPRFGNSVVVDVSSATTTYEEKGNTAASFANVVVGDIAAVTGSEAGGVVTATDVKLFVPMTKRHHHETGVLGATPEPTAAGTITTVGTNTFTIQTKTGSYVIVNVSSTATTYEESGVTSPSFANVAVGEIAVVTGSETLGVLTATDVRLFPSPPMTSTTTTSTAPTTPRTRDAGDTTDSLSPTFGTSQQNSAPLTGAPLGGHGEHYGLGAGQQPRP